MVIVLVGPDSYRRGQRLQKLREAFQTKFDPAGHSVTRLEGTGLSIDDLQKAVASAGLFSTKRFVVLSDVFAPSVDAQEQIANVLPHVSEDTILVVTADVFPQKKSELKTWLQQNGKIEEFKALTIPEAEDVVREETARAGATIDQAATHTLAQRLHDNTWQLVLVSKSLAYEALSTTDKKITLEQAQRALGEVAEENFFSLTDAVGVKNLKRSLELLQKHVNEGAVIPVLINILGKHITTLRLVKVSGPENEIPGIHPYVLQKARGQATAFTLQQLSKAHDALLQLDSDMKTGGAPDPATALALIVTDLCD